MNAILKIGKGWFPEEPGGLNRYFYDCVQCLPNDEIRLQGLVTGSGQVWHESQKLIHPFSLAQQSLPLRWSNIRQAFQLLQQSDAYRLVVSHFALYTLPILDLIQQPLVMHFHGPWALEGYAEGNSRFTTYFKNNLEKAVYQRADRFVVLSHAFKQILHQRYAVPEDKIRVIPGGVNPQRFQCNFSVTEARQQLGWPSDRPIVLAVRRLAKRMGLENLIAAIAQVRQQHPDILLLVAGKGSQAQQLQAQIEALNLQQNVQLLGYVPDDQLATCYRAANFSIVPSQRLEGFGLILLESLAAGTPVLGTPVGGIPEVLKPLNQNLVLNGTETLDLAQGIQEVLQGQRVLPEAQICQSYVASNYSWSVIAQQLRETYQALL